MYFGFYGKCYSFDEISSIFNVSNYFIKHIIAGELKTIRRSISTKEKDEVIKTIQKRK